MGNWKLRMSNAPRHPVAGAIVAMIALSASCTQAALDNAVPRPPRILSGYDGYSVVDGDPADTIRERVEPMHAAG